MLRACGRCGLLLAALLVLSDSGHAQTYPTQTIKIVVPTAPGGVADIVGRMLARRLTEVGTTAVVENRTGGGGIAAAEFVARADPDGHTVLVGFLPTHVIIPHLQKVPYDPEKDFAPVTMAVTSSNLLVVNAAVPVESLADLIAYAKANPRKLTYASQGHGSSGQIVAEQFKRDTGIDLVHVPYRGAAPAMQDLIAGHVSLTFVSPAIAAPHVATEKVRALAISSELRSPLFREVPTMSEAGLPQLQGWGPWFGFFVPGRTPRAAIDWLHTHARAAFTAPDNVQRLEQQSLVPMLGSPEETAAFIADEAKRWGNAIRRADIQAQ